VQSLAANKPSNDKEERQPPAPSNESYNKKQIRLASRVLRDMQTNRKGEPFKDSKTETLFKLVKSYQDFYAKREELASKSISNAADPNNAVFCVSECPVQAPFKTLDFYCTNEKASKYVAVLS
jgi:hypothetical protein